MMTQEELYRLIQRKVDLPETTICKLHKPCSITPACNPSQHALMLDFDEVEIRWHKKAGKKSTSSVDAITYTDKSFCFIEMKGWDKFLNHNKIAQEQQPSEEKKNKLKQQIQKQASSYDLQSKFLESVKICEEISEIDDLCNKVRVAYILVTDVNPKQNPIASLAGSLNMLAHTSTDWKTVCAQSLESHFKNQMVGLENVKPSYVFCQDLDFWLAKQKG